MQYSFFDADLTGKPIVRQLKEFREFGTPTAVEQLNGVPYFVNEFWTPRQRQGSSIHEVSYRACFKPQLPNFFIRRLTKPGDIVLDPFMGRGTTLIEAAILGRIPCGNDINPLSRALVEPRIRTPDPLKVWDRLLDIPWEAAGIAKHEDLLVFYHPETLSRIELLRDWLMDRDESRSRDNVDDWIRMVAINRLTGHSGGFFSVYSLPPNQAVSQAEQARINSRRGQTPPLRNVRDIIWKKTKSLLADGGVSAEHAGIRTGPSHELPWIKDRTVSLTVTSPPFLDVVNYEKDNWLRCWFLGIDTADISVSMHRNVSDWQGFVRQTLKELERITVAGGHVAFEVGEVRKGSVRLEENVIAASAGLGFEILGVVINQQSFTKTANCWGVTNNSSGTNTNRIVLLRRQ